jgi:hypothetical protein
MMHMGDRSAAVAHMILEHPSGDLMKGLFAAAYAWPADMTWPEFQRGCSIAAEIARADGRVDVDGDQIPAASRAARAVQVHACARDASGNYRKIPGGSGAPS